MGKPGKNVHLAVSRLALCLGAAAAVTGGGIWLYAQDSTVATGRTPVFRSRVDLVVLSFTVTDSKGKYVNGLKPSDFRILEDGIQQKLSTFSEGNQPAMQIADNGSLKPIAPAAEPEAQQESDGAALINPGTDAFVGTNVFVLFDTSNFMYHGFVYAEDAIADFVRGLDKSDSVAVYTFSRNLSWTSLFTHERN